MSITTRLATSDDLPRIEPLWNALYVHQKEHGMFLQVPPDGFTHWAKSMVPVLGKFGVIVLAEQGDDVVGFVAGRTRAIPAWFGGGQTGFVSDVFVSPDVRGGGISRTMVERAIGWFAERDIHRVELQVVTANRHAHDVYAHMGWRDELTQMVFQR